MIAGFGPDHPSWAALRDELLYRIGKSSQLLETKGLDAAQTEFERGQIAAFRRLISDVEEVPLEPVSAPGYE